MSTNVFTYKDTLGSILKKSFSPFIEPMKETVYESTEGFMEFDMFEYGVLSEKSIETPHSKYTIISTHPETKEEKKDDVHNQETMDNTANINRDETNEKLHRDSSIGRVHLADVIASKQFAQSHMSTMNTVYIGSLTIVGLYVLFRYMKY
jgi:hypothetical protein